MSALPATIPTSLIGPGIDQSRLPQLYVKAVDALQQCHRIDEIKEISNKHSAIAHYAQQAKDKTLLWYAKRIQLRAFERIGELLLEFPDYEERKKIAQDNGVSVPDANRAFDAAHIPKRVRDKMIESTPTPTKIRMAECGRGYQPKQYTGGFHRHKAREDLIKVPPETRASDFVAVVQHCIDQLEEQCTDSVGGRYTVVQLARAIDPEITDKARGIVMSLMATLGAFKMGLPKGRAA